MLRPTRKRRASSELCTGPCLRTKGTSPGARRRANAVPAPGWAEPNGARRVQLAANTMGQWCRPRGWTTAGREKYKLGCLQMKPSTTWDRVMWLSQRLVDSTRPKLECMAIYCSCNNSNLLIYAYIYYKKLFQIHIYGAVATLNRHLA